MNALDLLLILIGLSVLILALASRLIRAGVLLVGAYFATFTGAVLYRPAAFRLQALGNEEAWFDGVMFLLLFYVVFLIFYFVSRWAYPDTSLPSLGFLDHVLGGVVGLVVAPIVMAMTYAGVGVMAGDYWEPFETFSTISSLYRGSLLGPYLNLFLRYYAVLFYPFFFRIGFPPVLTA
jgi:hypothetical protein